MTKSNSKAEKTKTKKPNAHDLEYFVTQINAEWGKPLRAYIAMGNLLNEMHDQCDYGSWMSFLDDLQEQGRLPFGYDTAHRLQAIADHKILTQLEHVPKLPQSWATLFQLTRLPDRELEEFLANGKITHDMERKDVEQLIEKVKADGLYLYARVPQALTTLMRYQERYPNPTEIARFVIDEYVDDAGFEDSLDVGALPKLIEWLTDMHKACVKAEEEEEKKSKWEEHKEERKQQGASDSGQTRLGFAGKPINETPPVRPKKKKKKQVEVADA